jgi:hypothetical protein
VWLVVRTSMHVGVEVVSGPLRPMAPVNMGAGMGVGMDPQSVQMQVTNERVVGAADHGPHASGGWPPPARPTTS